MYAEHKHRSFTRALFFWLAKQLVEPLHDLAVIRGMSDVWTFTRGCHHCGHATWNVGPCCCYCGGDKDVPHMARAVGGVRPCCRVCLSAQLPPLPQQAATLQQSRKVGEIETYTGVQKAAKVMHRMPASIWNESNVPKVSGKLPVVDGNTERDTPQLGTPRMWKYKGDDTQPRLHRIEQAGEMEGGDC
jgi:hypothetical protein